MLESSSNKITYPSKIVEHTIYKALPMKHFNSKSAKKTTSFQKSGFTLVEVVIGAFLFFLLLASASISIVQTQKTAHNNVMHNTARTVIIGYIEQMRGISYSKWQEILADPVMIPIPTKSVNILATKAEDVEVDDPIYLDRENKKEVALDIITNENGSQSLYTMVVTIIPEATDLFALQDIKAVDITLNFTYESLYKGKMAAHKDSIRFVKTAISEY
jgi:type II secretory pathway pseudopilin PulG